MRQENYKTIGGGLASFCLQALVLAFFVMRLIAIESKDDSKISSYLIIEERDQMDEPLSFADHNQQLYFGFVNSSQKYVPLDPRIGQLTLRTMYFKIQGEQVDVGDYGLLKISKQSDASDLFGEVIIDGVYTSYETDKLLLQGDFES